MVATSYSPLTNWLPYKLSFSYSSERGCRWLYMGDKKFSEPFFQDTISKCRSNSTFNKHSVSSIAFMNEHSTTIHSVNPTAFIFHVSRCGSTLVSQLLSLTSGSIVLSEVPFLDELLRAPYKEKKPDFGIDEAFKSAMKFYGQKREGNETNLFVKTDSWHICFYEQLRKLYPQVPFIFLYRVPAEVIRSQQKRRGMQSVPGVIEAEIFGFSPKQVELNLDRYMAQVLEKYFTLFLQIIKKDYFSLLVNYNEGITTIMKKIIAFTNLKITSDEVAKMENRSSYHGKYPEQKFFEEDVIRQELNYLSKCNSLYEELEMIRISA